MLGLNMWNLDLNIQNMEAEEDCWGGLLDSRALFGCPVDQPQRPSILSPV